jgi:hypothetical protein
MGRARDFHPLYGKGYARSTANVTQSESTPLRNIVRDRGNSEETCVQTRPTGSCLQYGPRDDGQFGCPIMHHSRLGEACTDPLRAQALANINNKHPPARCTQPLSAQLHSTMATDWGKENIADGLVAATSSTTKAQSLSPKKSSKRTRSKSIGPGGLNAFDEPVLKESSGNRRKVSACAGMSREDSVR